MDDPNAPETGALPAEPAEPVVPESSPHEDQFDPERAMNTIRNLRAREKELEQQTRELEALRSDPDKFREFARSTHGWDLVDEEPDFEPVPAAPDSDIREQIEEIRAWKAEQENAQALNDFNTHLNGLAKEKELELSEFEKEALLLKSMAKGFNPESTEEAFNALVQYRESMSQRALENYRESKKAPHVSAVGQAGTPTVDLDDEKTRQEHMKQRLAQLAQDG